MTVSIGSRILTGTSTSFTRSTRLLAVAFQKSRPLQVKGVPPLPLWQRQPPSMARWMTTTTSEDDKPVVSKPKFQEAELLYEGPMSRLITSLKIFSLSSAVLSSVGLPALMVYKGVDMFTSIHYALMVTTMMGATSTTLGLQWIFSPYVYTLQKIPVRQCHSNSKDGDVKEVKEGEDKEEETPITSTTNNTTPKYSYEPPFLLKATTRSILLTKVEHVFDPETDVTPAPRATIRPFCSFFVKGKALYIHEQMISSPELARHLFVNKSEPIKPTKNPDPDDEFL